MPEKNDTQTEAVPGGYSVRDVHTGAFGTNSSAVVGAIGKHSRGFVTTGGDAAAQQRLAEMFDLIEELRDALEERRTAFGEQHGAIADQVDEIQEDLEDQKPNGRVLRKLGLLAKLLAPFRELVEIVEKLVTLVKGEA